MKKWKVLSDLVLSEKTSSIIVDTDTDGASFSAQELIMIFKMKAIEGTANQIRIKFNDEAVLGFLNLISSTSERASKIKIQNLGNCVMNEWGNTGTNEYNTSAGAFAYGGLKGAQISSETINKIEISMNIGDSNFTEGSEILIYAR